MVSAAPGNATFVGGGPAGLAPLVWAARQGKLADLVAAGLVVIERGHRIGAGSIGRHAIGSDTLADTFLECLDNGAEHRLTALRDHPAALAVAACRGGSAPLPLVATFLEALGEALSDAILSAGGRILTGCEALWSRRRPEGHWQIRLRTASGEDDIASRHVVLATGGAQGRDALYTLSIAGRTLMPRFGGTLMLSGEVLAEGGAKGGHRRRLAQRAGRGEPAAACSRRDARAGGHHPDAQAPASRVLAVRLRRRGGRLY